MNMAKKTKSAISLKRVLVRGLFVSVLLYSGYILASQQVSMYQKQKTADECSKMIVEAKSKNAELNEELSLVHTDEYIERMAREHLGYIKPDERIYKDVTK